MEVEEGTVVVDRKWGGTYRGTVVRRDGRSVFVAWHDSFVDDELNIDEVQPVPATIEETQWRGGIGVIGTDGSATILPIEEP